MEIYNDITSSPEFSGTSISGDTIYLDGKPLYFDNATVNINLEQIVTVPQETIYVVKKEVNPVTATVRVTQSIKYIRTAPRVVTIDNTNRGIYGRICCDAYSVKSNYVNCRKCVDKYLQINPNPELKNLTSTGTGCKR